MADIQVEVDGAIAGGQYAGIAALARTTNGHFLGWMSRRLSPMTNNEAEYQAAMLGLQLAQRLGVDRVTIVCDSEVVVRQMSGLSRVNSLRLKPLHQETCRLVGQFVQVVFRHVPRTENRLADALAAEAIAGRLVGMPAQERSWRGGIWG